MHVSRKTSEPKVCKDITIFAFFRRLLASSSVVSPPCVLPAPDPKASKSGRLPTVQLRPAAYLVPNLTGWGGYTGKSPASSSSVQVVCVTRRPPPNVICPLFFPSPGHPSYSVCFFGRPTSYSSPPFHPPPPFYRTSLLRPPLFFTPAASFFQPVSHRHSFQNQTGSGSLSLSRRPNE